MSFSILFPTNQFKSSSKQSAEEIQLLTLPPCTTVAETLYHIATKGFPPQYPYLYKHLSQAHSKVLSFVCAQAPLQQQENQLIIASAFRQLLQEKGSILTASQQEQIFQTCLECLNNLQSPANDELAIVIEIILKIHNEKQKLLQQLQSTALQLGRPAQPSISKVTAGRLATILGAYSGCALKNELVDILKRVLSDSEIQARKIGLSELFPKLLQVLDLQFVELHFQERIFEAVWDQNQQIGVLALEVILRNASKFSQLQQSSRIVKLFVDSLTSKSQKIAVIATSLMGEVYQKLQHVIMRSEPHCLRFWKSLVELSQSKNQKILNNMVYNLPGILILAAPYHKVDPICDIFIDLFYNPKSDKVVLASYYYEMVNLFPSKWADLRELFYWMLNQLLEDNELCDDAIKIESKIIVKLPNIKALFIPQSASAENRLPKKQDGCFQAGFCNYLIRYLDLLLRKKAAVWIVTLLTAIKEIRHSFSCQFIENVLLPKLYACLRAKTSGLEIIVETIVMLLAQIGSPLINNTYISKISTELMKSSRSFERDIALKFFYQFTFHFSIETVQQYRIGQKFLSFNSDKNFNIKAHFIQNLSRIWYFLTKEEKIQYSIIVNRLKKDSDFEIQSIVSALDFKEDEFIAKQINQNSKRYKEHERECLTIINVKKQQESISKRPGNIKDVKKEEVLRKRVGSTKGKPKIASKEPHAKRKVVPLLLSINSNKDISKHI